MSGARRLESNPRLSVARNLSLVLEVLKALFRRLDATVLYVTRDQGEAMALSGPQRPESVLPGQDLYQTI